MKLIELVREDQEDQDAYRATHRNAPMMHRKADDRPTVCLLYTSPSPRDRG